MKRVTEIISLSMLGFAVACGGGGGGGEPVSREDTFYVRAIAGNDANSGISAAEAFRTIQMAAELATDGDTIIVGPGIYRETVSPPPIGSPAQSVTFRADPSGVQTGDSAGDVLIDAGGQSTSIGFQISAGRDIVIDGFSITGASDAGIQIRSNSDRAVIRNTRVFGNGGDGIRVQDSDDVLVFNNLIFGNGSRGILIGGDASRGSQRARVIHNTVTQNADHGISIGTGDVASRDAFLRNNIVQNNGLNPNQFNFRVGTGPPSSLDGYTSGFNVVFPASNAYARNTPSPSSDVIADARFAEPLFSNYLLAPNSPAIDHGTREIGSDLLTAILARTTRPDGAPDGNAPDAGFHYP